MDDEQVWWLIEAHTPPKNYGNLTEAEAEECYQEVLAEEEANAGSGEGSYQWGEGT
jgi:hypothetical protein